MNYQFGIFLFAILVAFSAFFSASEVALLSISRLRLRVLLKRKNLGTEAIARLKASPQRMIITILIGNNFVNVAATAIATDLATRYFGSLGLGIAVGVATFLLLVFGEITPKSYSSVHSERIALIVAPLLEAFQNAILPLVILFEKIVALVPGTYVFPQRVKQFTEEELRHAVELGFEDRAISGEEKAFIERILNFADTTIRDVMTPKSNAVLLHADWPIAKAVKEIGSKPHSRYPVVDGQGAIVGTVYLRKLLQEQATTDALVAKAMDKPVFISAEANAMEVFKQMRETGAKIVVVVDAKGAFEGIVTLQDLLEEVVGGLEKPSVPKEWEGGKPVILVTGGARLREIEKELGIVFPERDRFDNLAAFLHYHLKRIPAKGDTLLFASYRMKVEAVANNVVEKVSVRRL